jgi:hypothetical protein
MDINVKLLDSNGSQHDFVAKVSELKFLKHASFAGLGSNFAWIPAIFHTVGLGFHFGSKFSLQSNYIKRTWPIRDPDDLREMSRLTGRAIGDIFAKSHFGARYTLCYEHALHTKAIVPEGKSPDFYCIDRSGTKAFTVEAKGFSQRTIGSKQFAKHKAQSAASQLPIHYSVASVTHNIYNRIMARVEDPEYDSIPLDPSFSHSLIDSYFCTVHERLSQFCEVTSEFQIGGTWYLAYNASPYLAPTPRGGLKVEYLVPRERATSPALDHQIDEEKSYFDLDGIGVRIAT